MIRGALLSAVLVLGTVSASAHEKVWVGLYLGRNSPPSIESVAPSPSLAFSLHEVFGYSFYSLIKSDEIELKHEWEHWIVPRNDCFIRVKPLPHGEGEARQIDYQLYKDGFLVVKGIWEPTEDTPLFINGPAYEKGRLIFVLEAR